mmetsp:Transcript_8446/g.9946  ORF Transcript_8446/g.9946 Transcript_8446/m.9946 type:complete len:110 (-) Transcript_8446:174-503(-)
MLKIGRAGNMNRTSLCGRKEYSTIKVTAGSKYLTTCQSSCSCDGECNISHKFMFRSKPKGNNTKLPNNDLGRAFVKYQWNGIVPHSEDLLSTVLKKSTSPSGHTNLCQK